MITDPIFDPLTFNSPDFQRQRLYWLGKAAGIGDWSYTAATNFTVWSDYLYDFYEVGKDFDCSILLDGARFYAEYEKEKMRALLTHVIATKQEASDEFQITMPDGRMKRHITTIHPTLDADGNVSGLYGILQDMTAARLAEENNSKGLHYSDILDRLPTELVVLNREGGFIYANQAALKSKERRGWLNKDRYTKPGDLGNWIPMAESRRQEAIDACVTTKQPVTFEEKLTDLDGTERTILRTVYPILDVVNETEFIIGYGIDISARKKNELELQRMAYVAEKTNGIVMITDAEKRIIWINHSFEKILGYAPEEVIGRDPASFLQGAETSRDTIQEIARALKSGTPFSGEILNYTKSGEKIWLYLNIAAVYDDTGKLINYVAVENDITMIKMAEQGLQKAVEKERELNRFKTQFVNLASHQFRTPLATIRSSIDLLDLKMESANLSAAFIDFFQKHKAIMAEETIRMTELMENILDIGRIDEGKIELCKKNHSFQQFMDAFVEANCEPAGQQRKLVYRFDAADRIISLDEILLRNVLRNIVSNAFKYSEGKQEPEMTVTFQDNAYFIAIKDYGIGIPDKDQPFLFQSFFRASNAKVFPGSGLGLMIAKKLIMLHGGDIYCESSAGHGCLITIRLAA